MARSDAAFAGDARPADSLTDALTDRWRSFVASRSFAILIFIIVVLLSAYLSFKAVGNQITQTNVLVESRVSLARYLDGTADRPFVHRVLTPVLVRFAQNVLHVPALVRMLPGMQQKMAGFCTRAISEPAPTCDNVTSYFAVAYGYFFVFLIATYAMTLRLFGRPVIAAMAVGFVYEVVNAIILLDLSHIYDFGLLMFVVLLLLALEYRKFVLYTGTARPGIRQQGDVDPVRRRVPVGEFRPHEAGPQPGVFRHSDAAVRDRLWLHRLVFFR